MNIEIVNLVYVDSIWERVGPTFQRAIDKCAADITVGELWQMCRSGNAFLIIARDGEDILMATVARFDRWPIGSVLTVLSLAGDRMGEWAEQWREFMESMAKDNGAIGVYSEGRDGWGGIFKGAEKLRSAFLLRV